MQVVIMNRAYRMSRKEYEGLLQIAREQVPYGIYAVEKTGYAELRCDKCTSVTQLKKQIRQFKRQGFRVLANTEWPKVRSGNGLGEVPEHTV